MGRPRRSVSRKKPQKKEEYDSDDPLAYKDMPVPDKKSSQYFQDEVDDFHEEKVKKLMASRVDLDSDPEDTADEEEVMGLDLSDSEEEEDMDSDLEQKRDEALPNEQAWGLRKKIFYDTDYVDSKGKTQQEAEAEEEEEEQEAKSIQSRLVGQLSEEDYDLHLLQEFSTEQEAAKKPEKEELIVKDLEKMSHKEKMKLLKKESPELLELIQDFKDKLTELKDELQPLLDMVKEGRIPPGKGADYLQTKHQLYLNYCTNVSFYLVLKARRISAHNHPVIERLVTYRNLINDLGGVDAKLSSEIRLLLSGAQHGQTNRTVKEKGKNPQRSERKGVKRSAVSSQPAGGAADSDLDEEAALHYYREAEERLKLKKRKKGQEEGLGVEAEEELDPDAKRAITYQIAKNKGLTPKRKKIDRNPRVKHREKFRRAKIRRKGQVREVRREEQRYGGELSGIRAGVKKGVKLR
ncbi:something about silencing protein 10 [Acipenser oxyrinchus oxyrinchus]|uniref:Something about silencing protein 10 n=1 Tax=Acipenser oxyrinchus oxyrinchus TaxID=40147 RepID=A0AAD8FVC9_ACIOX|nr:something about silencing protein 10 [Acipenser oxyrinchus oxyrinchus]